MPPKLYMTQASPPVRAVLMCAKAIDLELELVEVNLFEGEHLKPEYIKINPLHTVPTLDDDGFIVYDSHAIMGYLIGKYAKDNSLYPEDVKKRAIINQRLHFDTGILFARHLRLVLPILMKNVTVVSEELVNDIFEAYGFIEQFLQDNKYIAGDSLSIADFSIINSITNSSVLAPLDESTYPKISSWKKMMSTLPYYDVNLVGSAIFRAAINSKLSK